MADRFARSGLIQADNARMLAAALDLDCPDFSGDAALPLLWHWLYLLPTPTRSALAPDGHPHDGVPSPPRPGLRRMWAGGSVHALAPLRTGHVADRVSEVTDRFERTGSGGSLSFVTVRTTISQDGVAAVVEDQQIVYREPPPAQPAEPPVSTADSTQANTLDDRREAGWWALTVDPVLLFRFSALTHNPHRIHYDRRYARDAEGYPGLVVHGPLQALLMAELARGSGPVTRFEYRLRAPLFDGQQIRITAEPDESGLRTMIQAADGTVTATGQAY